jgi:hypothetical protein
MNRRLEGGHQVVAIVLALSAACHLYVCPTGDDVYELLEKSLRCDTRRQRIFKSHGISINKSTHAPFVPISVMPVNELQAPL